MYFILCDLYSNSCRISVNPTPRQCCCWTLRCSPSTCESLALPCSDIGRQLSELAHIPGSRTEQIHPLGHTNFRHSDASKAKERQKKSKYDELAGEQSAVFVPFIATTFGGLGKEALKFIDMLSAYARHSSAAASHMSRVELFDSS